MATASEEFLVRLRYWLVSGGTITRSACGTTTRRSVNPRRRPKRHRRLGLPARHREHAGAHDLGDEGGGVGRERDQQRDEFGDQPHAADEIEAAQLRPLEADRESERDQHHQRQSDDQAER